MIVLYAENELDFSHNGIGILKDCLKCQIKRELSGLFSMEIEYPTFSKMGQKIEKFQIIKAPTPSGNQLFRIQEIERDMDSVSIYATHIFFDLSKNFIKDTNIVGKTRLQAVQQVLSNTLASHKFSITGVAGGAINNCRIVRYNPVQALLGDDENTVKNRWGLELDYDNFNIFVADRIGKDTGVLISYRKNLTGIKETLDMSEVTTRIVPQAGEELLLPEYFIDSHMVEKYHQPLISHIKFDDIKVKTKPEDEEGFATKEQAYAEIRRRVFQMYSVQKVDIPFFNYEIEFEELGKTEEYKRYLKLTQLNIGDTVIIRHYGMNIDLSGRIISYEYDCILGKYIKIELGTIKQDLTQQMQNTQRQIQEIREKKVDLTPVTNLLETKINTDIFNSFKSNTETNIQNINTNISNNTSKITNNTAKINTNITKIGVLETKTKYIAVDADTGNFALYFPNTDTGTAEKIYEFKKDGIYKNDVKIL